MQQREFHFDGPTYDHDLDGVRLTGQLRAVYRVMSAGAWLTLRQLADRVGGSEASVSARLRDLRKPRFGGFTVSRRRVAGGLYEYRLETEI